MKRRGKKKSGGKGKGRREGHTIRVPDMSIKTDLASHVLSIRATHFGVQESSTGLVDEVNVLAAVVEGHFGSNLIFS